MRALILLIGILGLCQPAAAERVFFQTAFFVAKPTPLLSWRGLGFGAVRLRESVRALNGESFSSRPKEWFDYFDQDRFEDEAAECLNDPSSWFLVAGRALPSGFDETSPRPQLRLTFQPFCNSESPDIASDTSLQLILTGPERSWSSVLVPLVGVKSNSARAELTDAGFSSVERMKQLVDMPSVVMPSMVVGLASNIARVRDAGFEVSTIQWMSSVPGQLDWIFGRLQARGPAKIDPVPLPIRGSHGREVLSLGLYDFLPLVLRESYLRLSPEKRAELAPFHVTEDLHANGEAAERVLQIDLRVSDPAFTHHQQTSCIQCHSAQERIERARNFLAHGGAKEFGYFFRGLGRIENQPYISWRSLQESRVFDRKLGDRIRVRSGLEMDRDRP